MKTLIKCILLILLTSGCASQVPTTKFKMGSSTLELPKDMTAKGIIITMDGNNKFTLKADSITSVNNPLVIDSSGTANVAVIKAYMDGAGNIVDKGIQAGVKGASKAIVP